MHQTRRRVARIITRLNVGGPSIQAIDLSRDLVICGFDTCLIHGSPGPAEGDMTELLPLTAAETVRISELKRPISPLHDLRAWWRIYRALCQWRPDIVHTHMAKAGALGRLAALAYRKTSGARHVRLVHTYHGHVFEGYFGSKKTRAILLAERWLGRRTDVLVAISQQIRRDILETYRIADDRQVRVIPLGFNLDRLAAIGPGERAQARAELDVPSDVRVITTVGRLTAIKQHTLFLEMAARLLALRADRLQFLIAGDGELRGALERQAAALGIGARVRFLGWRRDLDRLYAATDIFVLTSRNEGTPVALIEAMAAGVACVSTDVGGVRDVISSGEIGLLVPFGDVDGLVEAVARLLDDCALSEALGRRGREAVLQRFQLRRLVDNIGSLYRELVGNSPFMPRVKEHFPRTPEGGR